MEQAEQLNLHNKQEYPPMPTADFNPALNDIIIYQTEDGEGNRLVDASADG